VGTAAMHITALAQLQVASRPGALLNAGGPVARLARRERQQGQTGTAAAAAAHPVRSFKRAGAAAGA
jgi:hypothetical protein